MKKKTRFKLSNDLVGAFVSAILFCLVSACCFSILFYFSFFSTLSKLNEEPIATISFKYKTAQRKFLDRVVWDRLRQDSPLYNGDTIHTSPMSEATITFTDGNVMELMENTMAQIYLDEKSGLNAKLDGGSLFVDGSNAANGVTINASGMNLTTKAGSSLSAQIDTTAASSTSSSSTASFEGGTSAVSFNMISGDGQIVSESGNVSALKSGEALNFDVKNGNANQVQMPSLVVTNPVPNAKQIYHTEGNTNLDFVWKAKNFTNDANFILEISSSKNFENIIDSKNVSKVSKISFSLKGGTYYWRLKTLSPLNPSEEMTASGKVQIIQSLPPSLITPVKDYVYNYRLSLPAVRLIWSESVGASSYNLEISTDSSFKKTVISQRSSLTSSIISTLKSGKYYWRVTPFYSINGKGFGVPSLVSTFEINQKGKLTPPVLLLPSKEQIVNTEESTKDITFSWKHEDDADKYTLLIADNSKFSNPKIKTEITENYFVLKGKDKNLSDGKWFWTVYQSDIEGNKSENAAAQSFYALKGNLEQHTVEPANGYRVAKNLLLDTKFTWKQNLPENFKTVFQIAKDSDFNNIIYKSAVSTESIKGMSLACGSYYWRIVSTNDEDFTLTTPGKLLEVIDNFAPPLLFAPGAKVVAREESPVTFKWNDIEGADFYKFYIYRESDNDLVYQDTVYESKVNLNMFGSKFTDKANYRVEIQARANAIAGVSSRRNGLLSQNKFYLVKLRPVEVTAPAKNAKINGLDAILKPGKIKWNSVEEVKEAQIVLTRTEGKNSQVVLKVPTDEEVKVGKKVAPKETMLDTKDGLEPGNYELIVYAKTFDGIDVSNSSGKNIARFTILPVEPLRAVSSAVVVPQVLDAAYLASTHKASIEISWKGVPSATEYKIEIKDNKQKILYSVNTNDKTKFEIDLLKLGEDERRKMQNGTFTYTIEALRRVDVDGDGELDKIIQRGTPVGGKFTTAIEEAKKARGKKVTNSFGRKK